MHAKRVSKLKALLNRLILYQQLDHLSCFTWIYLVPQEPKAYGLVIVDDYSLFTWTLFFAIKDNTYLAFKKFAKVIQNEKACRISTSKSDHGGEFQNERFDKFCEKQGIKHNFSAPRTPQQNGVVERKNRSLEELAKTLLNATYLPKYLWVDVVSTTCYVFVSTRRCYIDLMKPNQLQLKLLS